MIEPGAINRSITFELRRIQFRTIGKSYDSRQCEGGSFCMEQFGEADE